RTSALPSSCTTCTGCPSRRWPRRWGAASRPPAGCCGAASNGCVSCCAKAREAIMNAEATTTFDRERLLDEVVPAYLKEARAGGTPGPAAWQARYPELAADLAEFFADRAALERLAAPLRSVAAAAPGESVGDYELLEEVGRGGMGVVYRARQKSL